MGWSGWGQDVNGSDKAISWLATSYHKACTWGKHDSATKNSTAKSWRLGTWRMTFLLYTGFCSQNFQRLCICEILTYYGHLQGIYGWEMFGVTSLSTGSCQVGVRPKWNYNFMACGLLINSQFCWYKNTAVFGRHHEPLSVAQKPWACPSAMRGNAATVGGIELIKH